METPDWGTIVALIGQILTVVLGALGYRKIGNDVEVREAAREAKQNERIRNLEREVFHRDDDIDSDGDRR